MCSGCERSRIRLDSEWFSSSRKRRRYAPATSVKPSTSRSRRSPSTSAFCATRDSSERDVRAHRSVTRSNPTPSQKSPCCSLDSRPLSLHGASVARADAGMPFRHIFGRPRVARHGRQPDPALSRQSALATEARGATALNLSLPRRSGRRRETVAGGASVSVSVGLGLFARGIGHRAKGSRALSTGVGRERTSGTQAQTTTKHLESILGESRVAADMLVDPSVIRRA